MGKKSYIKSFIKDIDRRCVFADLDNSHWDDSDVLQTTLEDELNKYIKRVESISYSTYENFVDDVNDIFKNASSQLKDMVHDSLFETGDEKYWNEFYGN